MIVLTVTVWRKYLLFENIYIFLFTVNWMIQSDWFILKLSSLISDEFTQCIKVIYIYEKKNQ